jgi:hypothetical protein
MNMPMPDAETRLQMVDERVCLILAALPSKDLAMAAGEDDLIASYLADEWACLEVSAVVVAPLYGLDAEDPDVIERLKQAAHAALKAECERIAAGKGGTP